MPLLDRVGSSLEYMEEHLERVRKLNEGRGKHGRFLLGEQEHEHGAEPAHVHRALPVPLRGGLDAEAAPTRAAQGLCASSYIV